ncbi:MULTISPECIES: DUF523 domain-containing protein [Acinetobacter]|uniref:DUF523 domain-containing protein n=1 Tax=Acinetobacter piscicola TaxID=2006115 RepID=A0A4V1W0V9_9GAMM|nr:MULTISPECIES: DUF523 domain-containing protein [Acinetobacter]MDM1759013.1 DUF523 domain-containing protein [Acinetobacter sp. 256-1]MDM1762288.1 DUF523 domain-containing protein [Acinetobacter sp. 251-1]QOW47719.1 DUF523 domain-containing protein [Acinetobacter piscicola]RYL22710.1 DUF523 domain-containing protein [Acinetobacter piscicola]
MKYLISACLIGENVRYDAKNCLQQQLKQLIEQQKAVYICPEVTGGLSIPRLAAEIQGGDGVDVWTGKAKVITLAGQDVSAEFIQGAKATLALAQQHQVTHVILKSNSPSCGSTLIYDGSFTGQKIQGVGVTTALLQQHGFVVMTENEFLSQLLSS